MLLNSNVIHIHVKVVMLVRMIHTRLFAAAQVKSCPGMHSRCVIASLSGCARTVGRPPILGGGPGIDKKKLLPPVTGSASLGEASKGKGPYILLRCGYGAH